MLTGAIILDKLAKIKKANLLIRFIVVGHEINLLSQSTSVLKEIHAFYLQLRQLLNASTVPLQHTLRKKNASRTLITQDCVNSYKFSLHLRSS